MAVDGAQSAADENEGSLGEAGTHWSDICWDASRIKCSYEYAAGIQFASPGPTSRPNLLLNANPPASVTKFAAYLQV